MNTLQLLPYVTFDGSCLEAMSFYQLVLGGELTVSYFKDLYPDMSEEDGGKVMHAELTNGAMSLMASDTVPGVETTFGDSVRLTLTGMEVEKLSAAFDALSQGGMVHMPFEKQVWGQALGMLTDRFGAHWMVSERAE